MKLFSQRILPLICAAAMAILTGCLRDNIEGEAGSRPTDYPRVEMTLELSLPQMVSASAASTAAADLTSESKAMSISTEAAQPLAAASEPAGDRILTPKDFSAEPTQTPDATDAPQTRAGETDATDIERLINGIWVVEFDGTEDGSKLVLCEYYEGDQIEDNMIPVSVAEVPGDISLYVVANAGSSRFSSLLVGTTTLGEFEAMAHDISVMDSGQAAAQGLPMAGYYTGAYDKFSTITLRRLVAKVALTCTVQVPATESFLPRTSQIISAATRAAYSAPAIPSGTTGGYPDSAVADNFADGPASAITTGVQQVWYVPENLRGIDSGITAAEDKNVNNAPARSTAIEVAGYYIQDQTRHDVAYRVYLGQNLTDDFNLVRNHIYTVDLTVSGFDSSDARVESSEIIDLSATATANCYIASRPATSYSFDATVKGNGAFTEEFTNPSTGGTSPAFGGEEGSKLAPVAAKVLWETGSVAGGVIQSVTLVDGEVLFTTAAGADGSGDAVTEGNALIGVFADEGCTQLIWSWHIWTTKYNPDEDFDTLVNHDRKAYRSMKYNLGADATAETTTAGCYGLLYQWGRKDPFIGAADTEGTAAAATANSEGYDWNFDKTASDVAPNAIAYAIQHPTHFIKNASDPYDWVATDHKNQFDNLWGNPNDGDAPNDELGAKSIYDPCPAGWRVPPQDTWTGFTTTGQGSNTSSEWNVVNTTFNNGYEFYTGENGMATTFFLAAGYRSAMSGMLTNVGSNGYCWPSSPHLSSSYNAGNLGFSSGGVGTLSSGNRAHSFSVRCVKDEEPELLPPLDGIDLSAEGTANSYIVGSPSTDYKFNATVMGNGATTAQFVNSAKGNTSPAITPTELLPVSARVLWETGTKGSVIADGSVSVQDGYVVFTTAAGSAGAVTEGNAVIGVFDAGGTLIWSWHIWSTKYNPETDFDTLVNNEDYGSKTYYSMKYNLGANASKGYNAVPESYGLYYQWGRKDPFIGSAAASGTTTATTANDPAFTWDFSTYTADHSSVVSDPVDYAIKHPTHFIGSSSSPNDWVATDKTKQLDNLWGNPNDGTTTNDQIGSKSIYDPCPVGWRVPPQDTWTGFTTTGNAELPSSANVSGSFKSGWWLYTSGSKTGPTTFFPAAGYRSHLSGVLNNVGSIGDYWSSSPNESSLHTVGAMNFHSGHVHPTNIGFRAYGYSVRCVKEMEENE